MERRLLSSPPISQVRQVDGVLPDGAWPRESQPWERPGPPAAIQPHRRRMGRILIVDDAPASREAMSRLLQREGYETCVAGNGEEGIMQLKAKHPDLVLLDHMMPKVDGLTFLAQIRRFPKWKALPVIMMTGLKDKSHQR